MKRRLKIEVIVDYNKLMKKMNVEPVESGFYDEKEEDAMTKVSNAIHERIPAVCEVGMCIEDEETRNTTSFEKSNKMGSSCMNIRTYKG